MIVGSEHGELYVLMSDCDAVNVLCVQQFMHDCSDVMQLLLKTQTEMQDMPEDDPQVCCHLVVPEVFRYICQAFIDFSSLVLAVTSAYKSLVIQYSFEAIIFSAWSIKG